MIGKNEGKRTEAVKQQILTYIWEHHLAQNDRLPVQTELCKAFHACSVTVVRAIRALVEEGVLESRRCIGVFVKQPHPIGHPGWAVGLIGDFANVYNYSVASRCHAVQMQLSAHGCRCLEFAQQMPGPDYCLPISLKAFSGLVQTLDRHELNGILTTNALNKSDWEKLESQGIPVCYLGPPADVSCGVILDVAWFVEQAMSELLGKGIRHPRILIGPLNQTTQDEIILALQRVQSRFPEYPMPPLDELLWCYGYQNFITKDFRQWATRCLEQSPKKRPDGLVMCDDIMAMGIFSELIRAQGEHITYMPEVISMQNRGLGIDLPIQHLTIYWVDLRELGKMATELLLRLLTSRTKVPNTILRYYPQRYEVDHSRE